MDYVDFMDDIEFVCVCLCLCLCLCLCVCLCVCDCVCVEFLTKDSLEFPIKNFLRKVLYYGYPIKDSLLKDFT